MVFLGFGEFHGLLMGDQALRAMNHSFEGARTGVGIGFGPGGTKDIGHKTVGTQCTGGFDGSLPSCWILGEAPKTSWERDEGQVLRRSGRVAPEWD